MSFLPKRKDRKYRVVDGEEVVIPTREDIASSFKGGMWRRDKLTEWGVKCPPGKGWRRKLEMQADRVYGRAVR